MTWSGPRGVAGAVLLGLAIAASAAACAPGSGSASPASSASATTTLTSPVDGVLVAIDAAGLSQVKGFTLRLNDGREIVFKIGVLENGAQFPPGHLAEHMATSTPIRVSFRDEAGEHVAYRLEDAPAP